MKNYFRIFFILLLFVCANKVIANTYETDKPQANKIKADKIYYKNKTKTIIAKGNVKVYYQDKVATCNTLIYNKNTNKIIAQGNVVLKDQNNNIIHSDKINLSKDLGSGFVNNLNAQTSQNTYFTANNANRIDNGNVTIFNNAIYTACKTCDVPNKKKPNKLKKQKPLWRIKAKQIVWDAPEKTLTFKKSHFDIYNTKLIGLPNFTIPDYTVKRYGGFLPPHIGYNNYLGYNVMARYFINLAPNYDLTLSLAHYTKQGILGMAHWRHMLATGKYEIVIAGINQTNPNIFPIYTIDKNKNCRIMVGTKSDFRINQHWSYGWDWLCQNDEDFAHTYNISGYNNYSKTSDIYLTGLWKRNYLNISIYDFKVQDAYKDYNDRSNYNKFSQLQPWLLPQLDYEYHLPTPIMGGELKSRTNIRSIYRKNYYSIKNSTLYTLPSGSTTHLTSELIWDKTILSKYGFIFKPIFALRGDLLTIYSHQSQLKNSSPASFGLATAGLEINYPILINTKHSQQTLIPTAQILLRNNIHNLNLLSNENAQEFNFNALSLFQRDKFSGTDRVEYGHRANVGIKYSATLNNYLNIYAILGQSFQISDKNPYTDKNVTDITYKSGIDKRSSDYVSMVQFNTINNLQLIFRDRFDNKNFKLTHNEIDISKKWKNLNLTVYYLDLYGNNNKYLFNEPSKQLSSSSDIKLNDHWQLSLYQNIDLTNNKFANIGSAISYQNDCFSAQITYIRNHPLESDLTSSSFGFHFSLRTLMDVQNS